MRGSGARVLALDLGEVRIGLAVSDPLGVTAQPLGFLRRHGEASDALSIRALVEEHGAGRVVVGHPLLLSGDRGSRAEHAERFAERLRSRLPGDVAVVLWDERLTTAEAERILLSDGVRRRRRREVVDAMAAVLILQSWLDARAGDPGAGSARDQSSR